MPSAMLEPSPHRSTPLKVEDQWIDYNGHFNMAYYNVLFDRAGDQAFEAAGLGADYVKRTNCSHFTLESHNTYLRELHANDEVTVETQFLDVDHKRVHYVQIMKHGSEGWISCITEIIVAHVDLAAKKTKDFPEDVQVILDTILAEHRRLPIPPQVGHKIGIQRKG
jgi:acyl-CoA thioester hydrolase